jgi:hypothetical protein
MTRLFTQMFCICYNAGDRYESWRESFYPVNAILHGKVAK